MNLKFTFLALIVFIFSCKDDKINIEITRHSSDLLQCEKIFADNLKSINELNKILLQTGTVDTTSEQAPIKTAIITIDKQETFLTFEKSFKTQNQTTEIYKGNGYILTLNYEEIKGNFDFSNFIGNFIIENKTDKRKFNVEGKRCTL